MNIQQDKDIYIYKPSVTTMPLDNGENHLRFVMTQTMIDVTQHLLQQLLYHYDFDAPKGVEAGKEYVDRSALLVPVDDLRAAEYEIRETLKETPNGLVCFAVSSASAHALSSAYGYVKSMSDLILEPILTKYTVQQAREQADKFLLLEEGTIR